MRLTIAVVLLALSACASSPKSWHPTPFSPPPGAPKDAWEQCYEKIAGLVNRRLTGASEAASYFDWNHEERTCTELELMKECMGTAHRADMDAASKAAGKAVLVRQWLPGWDSFMDDALDDKCGPDGGGTTRVNALVRIHRPAARQAGLSVCACQ
jgi:hypothetical protein